MSWRLVSDLSLMLFRDLLIKELICILQLCVMLVYKHDINPLSLPLSFPVSLFVPPPPPPVLFLSCRGFVYDSKHNLQMRGLVVLLMSKAAGRSGTVSDTLLPDMISGIYPRSGQFHNPIRAPSHKTFIITTIIFISAQTMFQTTPTHTVLSTTLQCS